MEIIRVCLCLLWVYLMGANTADSDIFGLPSVTSVFQDTYHLPPDSVFRFNLTCEATGNPTPSITWWRNGGQVLDTQALRVFPGYILVTSTLSDIFGIYHCNATNNKGVSTSPKFSIAKTVLSSFPNDGEEISVDEDQYQYLRLPCSNRPMCVPYNACTYEWKTGDGEGIPTEERIFVDDEGTLHFLYVDMTDDKVTYVCGLWNELVNMHVRSTERMLLVVRQAPDVSSQRSFTPAMVYSNGVRGRVQQSVRLQCAFSGHPLPLITWLDPGGENIVANDVFSFLDNNHTLVIGPLTNAHEGEYTCRAIQVETNARAEGKVFLNVTGPPQFTAESMVDQIRVKGSYATFECSSKSLPGELPPDTRVWYQNGGKLQIVGSNKNVSRDGSLLTVDKLQADDTSIIQCLVGNSEGTSFREARLIAIDSITLVRILPDSVQIYPDVPMTYQVNATTPGLPLTYEWACPSALDNTGMGRRNTLPPGVVVSDGGQSVTFMPTEDNIQGMVGVYEVVISHQYDSMALQMNVSTEFVVTENTTAVVTTEATTTAPTTVQPVTTTQGTTMAEISTSQTETTPSENITYFPPPKHGVEEDNASMNVVPVAILVSIAIAILIMGAVIVAIVYRERKQGELVVNQPIVKFDNPRVVDDP